MTNNIDKSKIIVRNETKDDYFAAEKMIRRAFWDVYKPGADEHYLTRQLRNHPDYIPELTRLAIYEDKIIGAIYYAKSKIVNGEKVYDVITFGPLAVDPDFQKMGIGALLIRMTILEATDLGHKAIIIYGEPHYYPHLGFKPCQIYDIKTPDGTYLDALMAYELEDNYLIDKAGIFMASDVYFDIKSEDLEAYDLAFR